MINNRYIPNTKRKLGGFELQITPTGTVYHDSNRGMVKLDSLWIPVTRTLAISLPNGEQASLISTKEGLKTPAEINRDKAKNSI